jgi:hypothetical protein
MTGMLMGGNLYVFIVMKFTKDITFLSPSAGVKK